MILENYCYASFLIIHNTALDLFHTFDTVFHEIDFNIHRTRVSFLHGKAYTQQTSTDPDASFSLQQPVSRQVAGTKGHDQGLLSRFLRYYKEYEL